jgi:hypothetical protein
MVLLLGKQKLQQQPSQKQQHVCRCQKHKHCSYANKASTGCKRWQQQRRSTAQLATAAI